MSQGISKVFQITQEHKTSQSKVFKLSNKLKLKIQYCKIKKGDSEIMEG